MLKEQMEVEKESAKTSELKVIDANRRIDRLMSEKSDLEKVEYIFSKQRIIFKFQRATEAKNKPVSSLNDH